MSLAHFLANIFPVVFLIGFLIVPIWMIVRCVRNDTLAKNAKALWVVASVLLYPLGPYLYALVKEENIKIKMLSLVVGVIFALSGAYIYTAAKEPVPSNDIRQKAEEILNRPIPD